MTNKNFYSACMVILAICTNIVFAQSSTIQLPANDNTGSFEILRSDDNTLLKLFGDGGFYLKGTLNEGLIPVTGAGARLMWFPGMAAFRVGEVSSFGSTYWNLANIGYWSVAMGSNTRAQGSSAFAMGIAGTASGDESVAIGNNSTANGNNSFAFNGTTTGIQSLALGSGAQATNFGAISVGPSSIANGIYAITIGPSITTADSCLTIGLQNKSNGKFSVSIGKNARMNGKAGSFVIGDGSAGFSSDSVYSTANNQMTMRYAAGFRLYTNLNLSAGVTMSAGGTSWSSVSDSTKKENFIKADGEYFLSSLSKLRLGSWNYKSQSSAMRHYGPMAQEIFHYFGKDKLGTIGNDTTIATADMDGIIMICLQALEKRTEEISIRQSGFNKASEKIIELEKFFSSQNTKISSQQESIKDFDMELQKVKDRISALENDNSNFNIATK